MLDGVVDHDQTALERAIKSYFGPFAQFFCSVGGNLRVSASGT